VLYLLNGTHSGVHVADADSSRLCVQGV
jgi:hypothetical protein